MMLTNILLLDRSVSAITTTQTLSLRTFTFSFNIVFYSLVGIDISEMTFLILELFSTVTIFFLLLLLELLFFLHLLV